MIDPASPLPVDRAVICGPAIRQHDVGSDADIDIAALAGTGGGAGDLRAALDGQAVGVRPSPSRPDPIAARSPRRRSGCWRSPAPLSTSAPGVVTLTEPPAPVPAVVLEISAPDTSAICGAVTDHRPGIAARRRSCRGDDPAARIGQAQWPLGGDLHGARHCLRRPCVEVTLAPPDSAIAPPAVSTTSPAAPVEPASAEAVIPLAPPGPVPDNVTLFATVTATSPPWPGPTVVAAICAPPAMVRASAATVTEPPGPDCAPVAEAAIWVLETPAPSSISVPGVVTSTEPPAPVPAVVLEISAPDSDRDLRRRHHHRPGIAARRRTCRGDDPAARIAQAQRPLRGDLHGAAIA